MSFAVAGQNGDCKYEWYIAYVKDVDGDNIQLINCTMLQMVLIGSESIPLLKMCKRQN